MNSNNWDAKRVNWANVKWSRLQGSTNETPINSFNDLIHRIKVATGGVIKFTLSGPHWNTISDDKKEFIQSEMAKEFILIDFSDYQDTFVSIDNDSKWFTNQNGDSWTIQRRDYATLVDENGKCCGCEPFVETYQFTVNTQSIIDSI